MADDFSRNIATIATKESQESENLEERRLYEQGRNDRAALNHQYSLQVAKLNGKITQNLKSQKNWKAVLDSHTNNLWRDV